jgi:putative acetyltransferase
MVMLSIRSARPDDDTVIAAVTEAAFRDAPHARHTESFIVAALRRAGALSVSLVAEAEGRVIGHAALSPVVISDGSTGWFGLGPVSVLPAWQGHRVGSRLVQEALRVLQASGARGCVLLGDPRFYSRFGFFPDARLVLPGVPVEYFQVLSWVRDLPTGTVTFHEAFNATA